MTAEEIALEEFRSAVRKTRFHRRIARELDAKGLVELSQVGSIHASCASEEASTLARIIRAIRAEDRGDRMRASYEASVSEQVIHAETAWYDRGYEQGYAQGRRDALRGVQGAALYRHAELWQGRVRLTSADERRDIEACELAWAAQAAEEAAR